MTSVRKTYKDTDYLRNPADELTSQTRKEQDKKERQFEAYKMTLDEQKTKYMIKQSEAIAKDAE